jgi:TM2 domain-containing membrane protein YozV
MASISLALKLIAGSMYICYKDQAHKGYTPVTDQPVPKGRTTVLEIIIYTSCILQIFLTSSIFLLTILGDHMLEGLLTIQGTRLITWVLCSNHQLCIWFIVHSSTLADHSIAPRNLYIIYIICALLNWITTDKLYAERVADNFYIVLNVVSTGITVLLILLDIANPVRDAHEINEVLINGRKVVMTD